MKIQIHNISKIKKEKNRVKIIRSLMMGEKVLDSTDFQSRVLSRKMYQTNGMSNLEVYQFFKSGDDGRSSEIDYDLDINIEGYFSYKRVVGWTNLHGFKTWINRRYLNKFDESEVFGHIIHEAMHRYGFSHKRRKRNFRKTVPYLYGYSARDAFKAFHEKYFNGIDYSPFPLDRDFINTDKIYMRPFN